MKLTGKIMKEDDDLDNKGNQQHLNEPGTFCLLCSKRPTVDYYSDYLCGHIYVHVIPHVSG